MFKTFNRRHHSFSHALSGLYWVLIHHLNFRIHIIISAIVLVAALYFNLSSTEFIIIVFTIMFGLSAELINTSIETMTDLITKEWREEAKIAKDVSAGMMLLVAFGAMIVALTLFLPHIFNSAQTTPY